MEKVDISVILVNYNTKAMTADCIASIRKYVKSCSYEIILVDNASSDGSKELFERDKNLTYIYNDINLGFGKANNVGIMKARGEYFFLLNTDTLLENDALSNFLEYEKNNGNEMVLGAYLKGGDGKACPSYGEFPSICSELKIAWNVYTSRIPYRKSKSQSFKAQSEKYEVDVDYVVGADMFIPRKIIDDCGCFDERFFMYYEETDLQYRFARKNYTRRIIPGPQIVHLCQGSQKKTTQKTKKNLRKNKLADTSMLLYLKKYNNVTYFYIFKVLYFLLRLVPVALMPLPAKEKQNYYRIFF